MSTEPHLVLAHASQLWTCAGGAPKAGGAQGDAGLIEDGTLVVAGETIAYAGRSDTLAGRRHPPSAQVYDLRHRFSIVPGLVDAHTHAVFAGDRRPELRRRLAGASYADIAAAGGGIVSTVVATRSASEAELVEATRHRLDEMIRSGTTTCEIKSGYGLTTEAELKQLRVLRTLDRTHPISIVPTFMGAHEIPLEYRDARDRYVELVVGEMIPAVAAAGLAEWCDVFCERGVFTPEESERILTAGIAAGLKPRIHADELAASGGSTVAATVGARSADHLIFAGEREIEALARGAVTATLLPIAAFYLKLGRWAPARALIAAGVPVAIATDVNPGAGFSPSLPFAMALACFGMDLTFEEALVAATINGAWSLDRADRVGSLEERKRADALIVEGDAINLLRVDVSSIRAVIAGGRVVYGSLDDLRAEADFR